MTLQRQRELWLLLCADIPLACGLLCIGVGLFTGQFAELRVAVGLLAVLWGAIVHLFVWAFTKG